MSLLQLCNTQYMLNYHHILYKLLLDIIQDILDIIQTTTRYYTNYY